MSRFCSADSVRLVYKLANWWACKYFPKSGNKGGAQLEQDPSLRIHFLYMRYKGGARAP